MPKRKRRPAPPTQAKRAQPTSGVWTKALFAALGAVLVKGADMLDNLDRLPNAVTSTAHHAYEWWAVDQAWSGGWTDEGCIDCPVPDVFITINLLVRNGIASGEVQTPPMIGKLPYPHLLIDGKKVDGTVTGIFYDYVGGRKTKFAAFTLAAHGNDRVITVIEDPLGIFPKQPGDLFKTGRYEEAVEAAPAPSK
ncbi:hypothetical protein [Luteibacter aegosomatissinici]|uniref:hypothetical protein n=1 Tax=Luteibacter aegosomatissinici TaxID=2911539 RepID=UPI001FF96C1A|nr:hypothetical protein [Luteibacter aegosomatissinici]UPG92665.1 hypothetical protein L2Y97_12390 [Luteibacter aegosomatissinici]